jgi:hypothetical protein
MLGTLLLSISLGLTDGNVSVTLNAEGDLVVLGDAKANHLAIDSIEGFPAVRGLDGTTVNGSSAPFAVPADLRGRLLIDLGDGDDWLSLDRNMPAAGTYVRMGRGDDYLGVFDRRARGPVVLDLDAGDDFLIADSLLFDSHLRVAAGSGDDLVLFSDTVFHGSVVFRGGAGVDELGLDDPAFDTLPKVVGFEVQ